MIQRKLASLASLAALGGAGLVWAVSTGSASSADRLPAYQLAYLGNVSARDMNSSGEVAGWHVVDGEERAFFWDGSESLNLGTLGGPYSRAYALNDFGEVTGSSVHCPWGDYHPDVGICWGSAFLWTLGNMLGHTDITDIGAEAYSVGNAINASGQVLGTASVAAAEYRRGFVWDGETTTWLEGPPDQPDTDGIAINDSGWVVGIAGDDRVYDEDTHSGYIWREGTREPLDFSPRSINASGQVTGYKTPDGESWYTTWHLRTAMFWSEGQTLELGTLGGTMSDGLFVNDAGHVAGISQTAGDEAVHAFFWDGSTMHDIGTFGGTRSESTDLNNLGHVTGFAETGSGEARAFVWTGDGLQDLNGLISASNAEAYYLERGLRINDSGLILAAGPQGSFVLTPISVLLENLISDMTGTGIGRALEMRARHAAAYYKANDLRATCSTLEGLLNRLQTYARLRRPQVDGSTAAELENNLVAIAGAFDCS